MTDDIHKFKYKQVIVIRRDIEMSPAKLGVQVAHGAIESYIYTNPQVRDEWYMEGMRKVVLMVESRDELNKIAAKADKEFNIAPRFIIDFGLTELEPMTVTGVSFEISETEKIDKVTKRLKLYK
jgi:PTH2 family peptidyl-tRNA hydrolase